MILRKLAIILFAVFFTSICFAKNISLYEKPAADAKIIGSIDPATGIVPIFTPKNGDWVKVGDPQNGNVGWVKASELTAAAKTSNGFSFSQKMVSDGKNQPSYVIQLGIPASLTPEQTQAFYKQLQTQQIEIQQAAQKIIQNIINATNANGINIPMVVPVVVEPAKPTKQPNK